MRYCNDFEDVWQPEWSERDGLVFPEGAEIESGVIAPEESLAHSVEFDRFGDGYAVIVQDRHAAAFTNFVKAGVQEEGLPTGP